MAPVPRRSWCSPATRTLTAPLPPVVLPQTCSSSPRTGLGDRLPSPPPHPYPVALGAAGFSDPPPSTSASANSQKNRWVSAPACACPASPASTHRLAASGWLPSDRFPHASLALGSAQLGQGRSAWEAARLLNSSSPRLPRSPGGRPFNFLPRQLPFSTPAAASRDWDLPWWRSWSPKASLEALALPGHAPPGWWQGSLGAKSLR